MLEENRTVVSSIPCTASWPVYSCSLFEVNHFHGKQPAIHHFSRCKVVLFLKKLQFPTPVEQNTQLISALAILFNLTTLKFSAIKQEFKVSFFFLKTSRQSQTMLQIRTSNKQASPGFACSILPCSSWFWIIPYWRRNSTEISSVPLIGCSSILNFTTTNETPHSYLIQFVSNVRGYSFRERRTDGRGDMKVCLCLVFFLAILFAEYHFTKINRIVQFLITLELTHVPTKEIVEEFTHTTLE